MLILQVLTAPQAVSKGLTYVRPHHLRHQHTPRGISGIRAKLRARHAVSEGVSETRRASLDRASEQQEAVASGLGEMLHGYEEPFETAVGEPAGEETFETRVGIVEPVEEDEAEVRFLSFSTKRCQTSYDIAATRILSCRMRQPCVLISRVLMPCRLTSLGSPPLGICIWFSEWHRRGWPTCWA